MQARVAAKQLVDYAKTLVLPSGAKTKDLNAQIVGDELRIQGKIGRGPFDANFDVSLRNDNKGGMTVVRRDIRLPRLARSYEGEVNRQIGNLNTLLTTQLTDQLEGLGQSTGFQIDGDMLRFDFRKA